MEKYTHEDIEEMKRKAEKWDKLELQVAQFFINGDNENEVDGDTLRNIGEIAAFQLGFIS